MTNLHFKPPDTPFQIDDPEEYARNILRLVLEGGRATSNLMARADTKLSPFALAGEMSDAAETINDIYSVWMKDPGRLIEAQGSLFMSFVDLWSGSMLRILGEDAQPVVHAEQSDNRFKDPEWTANPYFDFCKQAYLITTHWAEDLVEQTDELDERTRQKVEFYLRLFTSAMSPSNFPVTNPEVMRETFASNAKNLVQGMRHLVSDLEKSGDNLSISQTDTEAFEVGRNLAITAGKVIFQNEIFQLIQYTPTTEKVRAAPLLIVPPWINKFYILDLTPQKSFVKFAIDQGFTVFIISWVNPDERHAHKTFENYMIDGLMAASDAVKRETGIEKINALGYCIGGTLLGSTLAYLAARDEESFCSATFLTAQFDFSMAGDLAIFTSDAHLASLEEAMAERGYLDSSRLANTFNMMRPKDLIWPYVVNNYLLGKKPFPFDILFWNQDSTRMPAANHSFYLREFYSGNRLAKGEMTLAGGESHRKHVKPTLDERATNEDHIEFYLREFFGENRLAKGQATLAGTTLDLKKVKLPIYELATKEDHIAPARSVFIGSKLFGGSVEFVLAGSGHIAGVINPPGKVKYQFWTAPGTGADTIEQWISMATEHPGSWWPHWTEWLAQYSGGWTAPREPGVKLGVIEDAPGSYVKNK